MRFVCSKSYPPRLLPLYLRSHPALIAAEIISVSAWRKIPQIESELKNVMLRRFVDVEVANLRFHDTRHTPATWIFSICNLHLAQKLLSHSDIKTTIKKAHAMMEDKRYGLSTMSATKNNKAALL